MARFVSASLAILIPILALPVRAQVCAPGSILYKGCFNVTPIGCCTLKKSSIGDITTVQWCDQGYLCMMICNPLFDYETAWCGWNAAYSIYDCVAEPSKDPTDTHPYGCKIPCGDIQSEGCCEGQTVAKYCKDGSMQFLDCDAQQAFCGWDPVMQQYTCMNSPAEGPDEYPYKCGSTACQAECEGKECGPNACGGTCGTCPAGKECNAGKCETPGCKPQCDFKDCGPDGCGSTCGVCHGNLVCNEAQKCAVPPCTPDCNNKQCGGDLCGGSCGACMPGSFCSIFYQCVKEGEDVAALPDVSLDASGPDPGTPELPGDPGADPFDPGGLTLDHGDVPLDPPRDVKYCPDGTHASYGVCVATPVPKKSGGGCGPARTGGGAASVWIVGVLVLIFRRGQERSSRVSTLERGPTR